MSLLKRNETIPLLSFNDILKGSNVHTKALRQWPLDFLPGGLRLARVGIVQDIGVAFLRSETVALRPRTWLQRISTSYEAPYRSNFESLK